MSANGIVVAPDDGPVWVRAPGQKTVLKLRNSNTAQSVMMFEETAPVGFATAFHLHRDSDEIAYVLSGEITFKIGDQITVGGPGTCAFMPRDVPHAWKSTGAEPGRVLFVYTPGRAGGLFEEMAENSGSRPAPDVEKFYRAGKRHGWEVVGPPPF